MCSGRAVMDDNFWRRSVVSFGWEGVCATIRGRRWKSTYPEMHSVGGPLEDRVSGYDGSTRNWDGQCVGL